MERKFKRDFDSLDEIFQFTNRFASTANIAESVAYAINLTVEELFTNMVKYNTSGGEEIEIGIERDGGRVVLTLVDHDVEPFDPATVGEVSVDQPIENRQPGGLGLYLVKSVVDKVSYEYEDRRMRITVVKNLEG